MQIPARTERRSLIRRSAGRLRPEFVRLGLGALGTAVLGSHVLGASEVETGARRWRLRLPAMTLTRRFMLANLVMLLVGGLLIGTWVGDQLERGIIDRTASIMALYVESFIEPHIESLASDGSLQPADAAGLDGLMRGAAIGDRIVALKIWTPDGSIAYSPNRSLIGQSFPVDDNLAAAFGGDVFSHISALEEAENSAERGAFSHLLETYVPVREPGVNRIIAVAEFYQTPTVLDREVADARLRSWAAVAGGVVICFLLLFGVVRQGSNTIQRQRAALEHQVRELSELLGQNAALHERVRTAAERTTTLSERLLRRISSDLHDGPGQMISLALMRSDALRRRRADSATVEEERQIELALQDALRDMRAIAAGLRLPELESLTPREVVTRAVEDHRRRNGTDVGLELGKLPERIDLPMKIALFRALQELLSNATRHGAGIDVLVLVRESGPPEATGRALVLEVGDHGPGFELAKLHAAERLGLDRARFPVTEGLGLAGIREQAELLGGGFEVRSAPGRGTTVRVWWPLPGDHVVHGMVDHGSPPDADRRSIA